ncbi:flavodoxin [bacterium]|nr:flavodoxin [bacterium]MBR6245694.1 flavodoxin [bacterium]
MGKTLVIYFSAGGHTKLKALQLAEAIEADIFEIEPVKKYTKADLLWMNPLSRSFREVATRKSKRPEIVDKPLDFSGYDKIFLGFPIWGWAAPSIVNSFLEKHDFSGKTIVVFATSGGTTKLDGSVKSLIPSLSETTMVKEGRVLNGEWSKEELADWAKSL